MQLVEYYTVFICKHIHASSFLAAPQVTFKLHRHEMHSIQCFKETVSLVFILK